MCKVALNQKLNGIELSFEKKPERATLDAIKAHGFRWNGKKCVWYAKQTSERLTFAESLGEMETKTTTDNINMEGVGHKQLTAHGADLAKIIREELKARNVKGVNVRAKRITYTTGIVVTIKASEKDFASVEEYEKRYPYTLFASDVSIHGRYTGTKWIYENEWQTLTEEEKQKQYSNYIRYEIEHRHDFNEYHQERKNYPQFTSVFHKKVCDIFRIANQWNYNNSDSMTDYFDVGYYLDIDIKCDDFEARQEMNEEERNAYKAEQEQEEKERAEAIARYEREREEASAAQKKYEEERKAAEILIYNNIRVEDLEKCEQFFVYGLIGGIGKECSIKELKEEATPDNHGALITRKVIFSDSATFETFGAYLLNDWAFLAGKGGTACEDNRLNDENWSRLTTEQRETLEIFYNDCVAVYVGENLQLVIDPEGYNYARYTYIVEDPETKSAAAELDRMRTDSDNKRAFYFPEPIAEQIKNIKPGDDITIYMCDGWLLNSIESGRGTVQEVFPGTWAQYEGYYIRINNKDYFIRDNKDILIYKGIKARLPKEVTENPVNNNMVQVLTVFDGLWDRVLDYYKDETPLIDTIQR